MSVLVSQGLIDRRPGRGSVLLRHADGDASHGIITLLPSIQLESLQNDPHYSPMAQALTLNAFDRGWTNTLVPMFQEQTSPTDFLPLRQACESGGYHGVVVTYTVREYVQPLVRLCQQLGLSLVWVSSGRGAKGMQWRVGVDNCQATRDLCEYLIERGCRRIGMISSKHASIESEDRIQTYYQVLADNGLDVREDLVFISDSVNGHASGFAAANYFADRMKEVDGLFITSASNLSGIEQAVAQLPASHAMHRLPMTTFDYRFDGASPQVVASAIQPITQIAATACDMIETLRRDPDARFQAHYLRARIITHRMEMLDSENAPGDVQRIRKTS